MQTRSASYLISRSPAFPADQSGPFCSGNLVVGYDGTVVQMGGIVFTGSGSNRTTTFRWWAGLLR